jgi:chromosome segregation ATPase
MKDTYKDYEVIKSRNKTLESSMIEYEKLKIEYNELLDDYNNLEEMIKTVNNNATYTIENQKRSSKHYTDANSIQIENDNLKHQLAELNEFCKEQEFKIMEYETKIQELTGELMNKRLLEEMHHRESSKFIFYF